MGQELLDSLNEAKALCEDVLNKADEWVKSKEWATFSKTLRALHFVVGNRLLFQVESEWRKEVEKK